MTLTLPTPDQLFEFWGDEADDLDEERALELITLASDLLWLATGLDDDPTDSRLANLVKFAILDMAINLFVQRDDIDALYSPAQSERIGSYSYNSRAYISAARSISNGTSTSVLLFDKLVQYLTDEALFGNGTTTTEQVFPNQFIPLPYAVALEHYFGPRDPTDRAGWYSTFA